MFRISFTKMKKRKVNVIFIFLLVISMGFIAGNTFETKTILLKFSINKGDSITKYVSVSGGESDIEIELSLKGIEKGIVIKENNFILNKGEEKDIEILFNSNDVEEGIYIGHIEIFSNKEKKIIPVIFEVESKDVFFDANLDIPAKYLEVPKGEKITAQLDIFDLFSEGGIQSGLGPSSISIEYNIYDLDGNIIINPENESIIVDRKVLVTKTMTLPQDIETGQYVFGAIIKYKSSVSVVTDLIKISEREKEPLINLDKIFSGSINILIYIGLIFLILILFMMYIIYDRNKLFLKLREYNKEELMRYEKLLKEQTELIKRKGIGNEKSVRKEVENKISKIKKNQKGRIKEFKKLKKSGQIKEMKKKLQEWKRKGYNITKLDYKLKDLTTKEMKDILSKWKKEYKA